MYHIKFPFLWWSKHCRTMILVMSNGNTCNSLARCFIFHVLWSVHRKWLKALTRMSTFHPYIDRLCKTNPYTNEKCLFHLQQGVYDNIYTVDRFSWSFDMTSQCLNWQLESLWWLPGLIGDIGKNCWLMVVIKKWQELSLIVDFSCLMAAKEFW